MGSAVLKIAVIDVLLFVWHGSLCEGLAIESFIAIQAIHTIACCSDDVVADAFPLALLKLASKFKAIRLGDTALTMLLSVFVVTLVLSAIKPAKYAAALPYGSTEIASISTIPRVDSSAYAFVLAILPITLV